MFLHVMNEKVFWLQLTMLPPGWSLGRTTFGGLFASSAECQAMASRRISFHRTAQVFGAWVEEIVLHDVSRRFRPAKYSAAVERVNLEVHRWQRLKMPEVKATGPTSRPSRAEHVERVRQGTRHVA